VLASKLTIYEGACSSIGEVKGFEQEDSNLGQDWFIEGKVPRSRINEYFSSGLGDA